MPTIYNLRAATNVTFIWTRDFSALARVYNVAAGVIRMQARISAAAPDYVYEWVTGGTEKGTVSFDPATGLCVFAAPEADMASMPARLIYDAVLELGDIAIPIFYGKLVFLPGVTRSSAKAGRTAAGDTVTVENETGSTPAVLPVSLTAAVAAAQAAQTAAIAAAASAQASAASMTPSGIAASFATLSQGEAAALAQLLIAALPDMSSGSVPVESGQAFVDTSGFFVRAQ